MESGSTVGSSRRLFDNDSVLPTMQEPNQETVSWPQVCQIIVGLTGLFGNLTCVVLLCRRSVRNNTNLLIVNQAVVDGIASTLLMAATTADIGGIRTSVKAPLAEILYCYFWNSLVIVFGCFAVSTFNMVALSIERYLAVVHPIWYSRNFKKRLLGAFIASVWVLGPAFQVLNVIFHYEATADHQCRFVAKHKVILVMLFIWEYFFPVCVMTYSFAAIIAKFRKLNKVAIERGTGQLHLPTILQIPKTSVAESSSADSGGPSHETGEVYRVTENGDSPNAGGAEMGSMKRSQLQVPNADCRMPQEQQLPSDKESRRSTGMNSALRERAKPRQAAPGANIQRRNTTRVLIFMYLLYLFCWSPNQWAFFSYTLGVKIDFLSNWYMFLIFLANMNSCVNPFLFALRLKVYRQELNAMCKRCFTFR
ncbi:cholecystokinin receptor type A-like [Lytechinus variegatus]|uniref:cholecystokinin receptor type A-like n=1 Tax=Lytechinus variegatus TaxID=7654 RepID=UPI001BB29BDE|nr:cholecystokinin receptor type A-like [Lytechinus variegatus]